MPCWVLVFAISVMGPVPDKIADWIHEIEQMGGGQVLIAHVEYVPGANQIRLAPEVEHPEQFAEFLRQPEFVRQFVAAQALTVSRQTPAGPQHLVFINLARLAETRAGEEAILGHELGHAWLRAKGYPAATAAKESAHCLAIHATDVVQHVLIRQELARRGIDAQSQWIQTLNDALDQWKANPLPPDLPPCERIQTASQWVDVRLGLDPSRWPRLAEYESQLSEHYPGIERVASGLADYLVGLDLTDKDVNRRALVEAVGRLQALSSPTTALKTNQ